MEGLGLQKGRHQHCMEEAVHLSFSDIRHVRAQLIGNQSGHHVTLVARYFVDDVSKSAQGSFDVASIISVNQQQVAYRRQSPNYNILILFLSLFLSPVLSSS